MTSRLRSPYARLAAETGLSAPRLFALGIAPSDTAGHVKATLELRKLDSSGNPKPEQSQLCRECHAENDADSKFCDQCGAELRPGATDLTPDAIPKSPQASGNSTASSTQLARTRAAIRAGAGVMPDGRDFVGGRLVSR